MNTILRGCLLASASWLTWTIAGPAAAQEAVELDTITVTGTKTEGRVVDQLGGASVVTKPEIDRIQPRRTSDTLRNVPGVTTQENGNSPATAVNVRGLQNFGRVAVTVDGARQNFQQTGHAAAGTFFLDPAFIGGVDVVRGPVSTIYGSGAVSGVVAFRTRSIDDILAPDERMGVEQTLGFGTNGAGPMSSTSAGLRIGNAVDLFGQFVIRDTNPYRDGSNTVIPDSGTDLAGGLLKATIRPADGHTLSLGAHVQQFRFTNNGTSAAGTRFSHDVATGNYVLGYRFNRPDTPLLDFNAKVYHTTTRDEQRVVLPTATYRSLGVTVGAPLTYDIGTTGFDVFNTSRFDTGPLQHALTSGIDGVFDEVTTTDAAGGYGAAFTPSGKRQLVGGFVQNETRFAGWLRVLGALRYDTYDLKGGAVEADGSRLSPKLTIGVTPVRGIEVYGTYAEAYRAPALSETLINGIHPFPPFRIRPNAALRPETARNLEAGVNISYDDVLRPGDALRGKVSAFTNRIDDYIDQVSLPGTVPYKVCPSPFCPTVFLPDIQYQNVARARIHGVEAEASYDWGDGFVALAGSRMSGRNLITDTRLVSVQPDKLGGTIGFRFLDRRLTIGSRFTVYDEKFVPPAFAATFPASKAYGLVDVFASYKASETVRGDFIVENLLDRRYRKYLDSDNGAGLTAKFAVTVKFASR